MMDVRLSLQGDAAAAIITPFVVLLVGWIVATMGRVKIARRQAEIWNRLVDKLAPDNVAALLASEEGGTKLLDAMLAGPDRPHARIILAAQSGVVLLVTGLAFLALSATMTGVPAAVGVMVTAAGLGLAASAAVGYRLSKEWGLLTQLGERRPTE